VPLDMAGCIRAASGQWNLANNEIGNDCQKNVM